MGGPVDDGTSNGAEWLAQVAADPGACRRAWRREEQGIALLPAGRMWDVLIVAGRLGVVALDVLARYVPAVGPVLSDPRGHRVGFFVPAGTAARWVGTGVRGAGEGSWIAVPEPRTTPDPRAVPAPGEWRGAIHWLVAPDGSGVLNDPVALEIALHEAALTLADRG